MSLLTDLLTEEVSMPVVGKVHLQSCPCCLHEGEEHLRLEASNLLDLCRQLREQGAQIIQTSPSAIFFESETVPTVQEGKVELFEDIEQFAFGMDTEDGQGVEIIDAELEDAMSIVEIPEADVLAFQDFNKNPDGYLETATFEWLSEIGLVEGTPQEPVITDFGAEFLDHEFSS